MAKITRTIKTTTITGYPNSNPSFISTLNFVGNVADPCACAKKELGLVKTDSFICTELKEQDKVYSMDLDKFIENAEVEE